GKIRARLAPELRSRLDAEFDDLLQEVARTVLVAIGRFEYRGPGSLFAWMRRVAERVVGERIDYWRAARRNPGRERLTGAPGGGGRGDGQPGPAVPARGAGPATDAATGEERRRIRRAMVRLSERHHDIILLRFFAGADWDEVARHVGSPSADAARMECLGKSVPALAAF